MHDTLPWYKSKIIVGAVISIASKVLVLTGILDQFTPEDSETLTNTLVLIGGGIGDLMAFGARLTQKTAPTITVTK